MTTTSETSQTGVSSNTNAVAISNQKGGAGKTTASVHLAGALNARGYDVLVVDLDKQGGLTNAFGHSDIYYDLQRETTMYEVLSDVNRQTEITDLIQSGDEFDIAPATERYMNQSNISQLAEAGKSRERLGMALEHVADDYEWIIIDCTPDLNVLTDNAIIAAGNLLIPFFPEELNKNSLRLLLKQIKNLEGLYGQINDLALMAGRVERNREHKSVVESVDNEFPHPLFSIPKRTDLSQSISKGETIFATSNEDLTGRVRDAQRVFDNIADLLEREVGNHD